MPDRIRSAGKRGRHGSASGPKKSTDANRFYGGLETITNRYALALLATWREATAGATGVDEVPFTKEDVVRHSERLRALGLGGPELNVKNLPDIIYTFRARAELPPEIARHGHYAIVGRGKGRYAFVRIPVPNRIASSVGLTPVKLQNKMPHWTLQYAGSDEQAMLANINENELVAYHLRLRSAFQLQSHLRMGVRNYGQVEIDAIFVGEGRDGSHVGIAIDAKDVTENDRLNVSQLFGVARALDQLFPNIQRRLLGAKPTADGGLLLCEFSTTGDVKKMKAVGKWVKYKLS